jgi:hypothetical protein
LEKYFENFYPPTITQLRFFLLTFTLFLFPCYTPTPFPGSVLTNSSGAYPEKNEAFFFISPLFFPFYNEILGIRQRKERVVRRKGKCVM